jgi:hypothetical protein
MGIEILLFRFLEMGPEYGGGHTPLIAPQGHGKVMVPPEGPGIVETALRGIVDMDPSGGNLFGCLVDGPKAVLGQTLRNPFIEIPTGSLSHDPELANADGVKKNSHSFPPRLSKIFADISPGVLRGNTYMPFFGQAFHPERTQSAPPRGYRLELNQESSVVDFP